MIMGVWKLGRKKVSPDTPDNTTFFDVVVPNAGYEFQFLVVTGLKDFPAGGTIDWGDGSKTVYDSWASETAASSQFNYYATTSGGRSPCAHVYASAGNYTIKMKGNICGASATINVNNAGSAPTIRRMSFMRTDAAVDNYIPICRTVTTFKNYPNIESADFSRVYDEAGGSFSYVFGSTAQHVTSGWHTMVLPKKITTMSNNTFLYCDSGSVQRVVFPDKTMAAIRALRTASAAWNFGGAGTGVVFGCTDGEIRNVNGTWTDFPSD